MPTQVARAGVEVWLDILVSDTDLVFRISFLLYIIENQVDEIFLVNMWRSNLSHSVSIYLIAFQSIS